MRIKRLIFIFSVITLLMTTSSKANATPAACVSNYSNAYSASASYDTPSHAESSIDELIRDYQLQELAANEGKEEAVRQKYEAMLFLSNEYEARLFLTAAVEEGYQWAIIELGRSYVYGRDGGYLMDQDIEKGIEWLHKADADVAHYHLGAAYAKLGNYESALWHYQKASEMGMDVGREKLRQLFDKFYKESQSTFEYFIYAITEVEGNKASQYLLSICYLNGYGTEQNTEEGLKWLRKSADQGYSEALYLLGILYYNGKAGLERNRVWAYDFLAQGATEHDEFTRKNRAHFEELKSEASSSLASKYELALCYYFGCGTDIDYDKAFTLMQEAAAQGSEDAYEFILDYGA